MLDLWVLMLRKSSDGIVYHSSALSLDDYMKLPLANVLCSEVHLMSKESAIRNASMLGDLPQRSGLPN